MYLLGRLRRREPAQGQRQARGRQHRRPRHARPAIALTDLEPQACYLEGLPAFLGVLENVEDDWPRFLTTFAKECAAIGGCAQRLDKRHEGAAYKSADQRPLDPAEAALVRVAFAHDIRLHAAATEGHTEAMQVLVEAGAAVDAQNEERTPPAPRAAGVA